jgi:hypothetical protein
MLHQESLDRLHTFVVEQRPQRERFVRQLAVRTRRLGAGHSLTPVGSSAGLWLSAAVGCGRCRSALRATGLPPAECVPYFSHMDDITFRVRQRRGLLIGAVVCAIFGIGAVVTVATGARYSGDGLVIVWGFSCLLISPFFGLLAFGYTTVSADRLSSRTLGRSRSCRWDEIDRIDTRVVQGRGTSVTQIVVLRAAGRPLKLSVPNGNDPDFASQLSLIEEHWQQHAPREPS